MNMTPEQISQKLAEQLQSGQFNSAAKLAKRALKKYPGTAHLANVAGTALANADQGRAALPYFQMALKFEPNHEEYQNNLVHAYIVVGQHGKAEELGLKLMAKRSEPSKVCHLLAFSAELTGQTERVVHYTTKGLETAKQFRAMLLVMRGDAYGKQEKNELAEADFLTVLAEEPMQQTAMRKLIGLYLDTFQSEKAEALIAEPLRAEPNNPTLMMDQVEILLALGKVQEARTVLTKVREMRPDLDTPIIKLAGIATAEERPELIAAAESFLKKLAQGTNRWCTLCMTLGNLYFSEKNYKVAGRYLAKANRGRSHLFVHHPEDEEEQFKQILEQTPPGPAILKPVSEGRPKPIFILGQPRSGTTLTEMILTTHPDVASCGELSATREAWRLTCKGWQRIRRQGL